MKGRLQMITPETSEKVEHALHVVNSISEHKTCSSDLKNLLQNIRFFIIDFKFEEFDHVSEWLKLYDLQSHATNPFPMHPPIHPDYVRLPDNRFEKEFEEIKNFFEFVRGEIKKVGA